MNTLGPYAPLLEQPFVIDYRPGDYGLLISNLTERPLPFGDFVIAPSGTLELYGDTYYALRERIRYWLLGPLALNLCEVCYRGIPGTFTMSDGTKVSSDKVYVPEYLQ